MSFAPARLDPVNSAFLNPLSKHAPTWNNATAPVSGTWGTANLALFFPLYLWQPFPVTKAYWTNGATAATDSIDIGVYAMTNLSTGRLDILRSYGATVASGVSATQSVSAPRVSIAKIDSGADAVDRTKYTTASVTLKAGRLYLLCFANDKAATPDAASTVQTTGGAAVFTSEKTSTFNTIASPTQRVSVWRYMGSTDVTDTIDIDFGANTQIGLSYSLIECAGVDQSGSNGAGAVVQSVAATATDSGTSVTATLAAFGSANNATFGVAAKGSTGAFTAGAGFTKQHDVNHATPNEALASEWRVDNSTSVGVTWSGNTAGQIIGLELKADTTSFIIPRGWLYMGMTVNGTTTTVMRRVPGARVSNQKAGQLELTSTFPLPSSLTPVAISAARAIPVAGFAARSLV